MKKVIVPFTLLLFLFSCKKNDKTNTEEVRLQRTEYQGNFGVYATDIGYDEQGRIVQISQYGTVQEPTVTCNISYSGNEVILTPVPLDNAGTTSNTTITLLLDPNKKPLKRIEYSFTEFKAPLNNPQRTYIYDTLVYYYNPAGLLAKVTGGRWDSVWFNPGAVSINTIRSTSVANYTIANGNLAAINKNTGYLSKNVQSGTTFESSSSVEENTTYAYTKQYPNKMDFANAAVLNEFNILLQAPLDPLYANFPDRISVEMITRDQNGVITETTNSVVNTVNTYNISGFLSTVTAVPPATGKVVFIYNR